MEGLPLATVESQLSEGDTASAGQSSCPAWALTHWALADVHDPPWLLSSLTL